ncbi:MAG: hypothetical protein OEU40_05160, partial [Gammaproteobacteria bacterium]|nr:hypothetical protein [Gammaproteobacteria bacterium]
GHHFRPSILHDSGPVQRPRTANRQIAETIADVINRLIDRAWRRASLIGEQILLLRRRKLATADAEQPNARAGVFFEPVSEQLACDLIDLVRVIDGGMQALLSCKGLKIGLPDLDLYSPGLKFRFAQSARRRL